MCYNTIMIRIANLKLAIGQQETKLIDMVAKKLRVGKKEIKSLEIARKSIDSRKKDDIKIIYSVDVKIHNEQRFLKLKDVSEITIKEPQIDQVDSDAIPVIIGSGPAGLFAALALVDAGLKPIIIERGCDVDTRKKDIDEFFATGVLNENSNVQFGAGGAGTFSDGKLTSGMKETKKRYFIKRMIEFGAPKDIAYDQKPHVGTDILIEVIRNICDYLVAQGCELRFNTLMTDLIIEDGQIAGVVTKSGEVETKVMTNHLILAIGHSARDTFEKIYNHNLEIQPKPFSLGLRIEHKREAINFSQYGKAHDKLPTASYKLNCKTESNRGVYTFCMCPGGVVVAAASEAGHLTTNGMSYHARDLENSNSAILVTITPEDYVVDNNPLSGIHLQRELEKKAFEMGGSNYYAPVQTLGSYLKGELDVKFGQVTPSYTPGTKFADLNELFPSFVNEPLKEALSSFGNKIKEFENQDAILTGIEARSSSPITIVRDEKMQSNIKGIYPCGEGAGYAGGIVSAATDGVNVALKIIEELK